MNRLTPIVLAAIAAAGGCMKMQIEGGDKPIHIVMDVNLRVSKELDNFFAFEDEKRPASSSKPASVTLGDASDIQEGGRP